MAGVTGNLRYFKPHPLYFASGEGSKMTDIDGNEYIDCFLCNGPLQLGHKPAEVLEAIRKYQDTGLLVVNPTVATEAAERLVEMIPCAERVRFLNTGTEAVMIAIRVARAYTGRTKIIKFFGHYHGQSDQFLVGLGNTTKPLGHGVPDSIIKDTLPLPYGGIDTLKAALTENEIAAVILDPVMHNGGLWAEQSEYLAAVRTLTIEHGTVLIFDEVITGFRLAAGGAQEFFGVTPDLATFGKALSAGEKVGAVVGREEVMAVLDPRRDRDLPGIFQSGTSNDGTSALAAAIGAMDQYKVLAKVGGYDRLAALAARLADGLRDIFASHNMPRHINQLGPMIQMFLTDVENPSFENFSQVNMQPLAMFTMALLAEGVLFALPGSTHVYLSFAHTDEDIDAILRSADKVLGRYDFACLVEAGKSRGR